MLENIKTAQDNYEVLRATLKDASDISELLKEVALWLRGKNIDQWGYLAERLDDENIKTNIKRGHVYIVKKDNAIVGTFALNQEQGEWDRDLWGELNDNSVYIHRLAVARSERGKGLGQAILKWIENLAKEKEIDYIKLDCVKHNTRLNQFYQACNYQKKGSYNDFTLYEKEV